jgi:signal transduction histidine kinase
VDINAVLKDIVSKLKDQWQINSVEIKLELDDSIPSIRAPIGQIAEIFRNLMDNALRAMPRGGNLNIFSHMTMNKICVSFQDTGSGIPPDIQKRLFIKPVPSKDPNKRTMGLGLWLSQLMLKRIGGNIKIESSDAAGTIMMVQLSFSSFVEKI